MAELLLLRDIFALIAGKNRVNLKDLYEGLYNPILAPYAGDFDSFKNIFYRLNQEGVIKSHFEGDVLFIESIKQKSHVHESIDRLIQACKLCSTVEEFEKKVHTSELNRHFMDDEEIKAVFFQIEGDRARTKHAAAHKTPAAAPAPAPATKPSSGAASTTKKSTSAVSTTKKSTSAASTPSSPAAPSSESESAPPANDPLSRPVATSEGERIREAGKVEEMKGIFEKKIDKLKALAKDYVESLLGKQNEMDLVVLRYLLNDLLPLRDLDLNTDALILEAVRERDLPFVLDGTVYKRKGPRIKTLGPEIEFEERTILQRFGIILSRCLMDAKFIEILALQRSLEAEKFAIPEGETLETLLEKTIRQGFFKGYVDLVEQRVYRAKTEAENYQELFLKDLNRLSKEIASDATKLEDLKKSESKIPPGLELLLMSPEKRGITGVLDNAEALSQKLQDFILTQVQVGKQVSVSELSRCLKDHVHRDHVDVPYAIDEETVERILEKMVEDRKIAGFFPDQSNFVRKK
jgi:GTPase SAR1 family protein